VPRRAAEPLDLLRDPPSAEAHDRVHYQDLVKSAAFSSDSTRMVTASYDRTARVWDVITGKHVTSPLAHQDIVESAAFSPAGTCVVTAGVGPSLDRGMVADWTRIAERRPFMLCGIALVLPPRRLT
jgi:WD40 repeat protein